MRNLIVLVMLTAVESPGELLSSGMQLVYASGGAESPPWTIDSVSSDAPIGGMSACRMIRVRTTPSRPELRAYCARGDTLFAVDMETTALRAIRPVGKRMSLELRGRNSVSLYETADASEETISGMKVRVVATTVTTRDSTGRVARRLRERYSLGLATATGGVFEVPDSTQPGGWRTERAFELVRIVRPN